MLAFPLLRLLQALAPALALGAHHAKAAAIPTPCSNVDTRYGQLCAYPNAGVDRFTMPYAKPPTGANRFADPVPLDRFDASLDTRALPQPCAQFDPATGATIGSEDCLYMTIYTPEGARPPHGYPKLPVLVWVHGGSFTAGGTAVLDPTAFAKSQQVIVVMVQYRLGAFGWLKADDLGVAGNFGLKDVVQALKMVQEQITLFGGDPTRVTLAGQSSGAEIVKSLLVTPAADSLFHRAILQSAPLDYPDLSVSTANTVGRHFVNDLLGLSALASLRSASVASIVQAQLQLSAEALGLSTSLPDLSFAEPLKTVVDGSFVTRDFRQVISNGGQLNVPSRNLIFTTVKEEGCASVGQILTQPLPTEYFPAYASAFYPTRVNKILSSGLWDPSKLKGDSDAVRKQFSQLATDFFWTCPNHLTARSIAKASGSTNKDRAICKSSVTHEDDILAIFDSVPSRSNRYVWLQRQLVNQVQSRWAAFARTGEPNADAYGGWSPVSGRDGELTGLAISPSGGALSQRTQQCAVYTYA
ncbi:hypothetical protein C6P46_004476 [Rhodotorula mucilaginosa]|uniref:Carboxylic ester hydrolase n=1 Tax=Rhodotorula mucilaginosa TaxID=5537 RepID=A0A9P6W2E4_RHOMI|nr:hypothetical protein C6P46_004476 [Rhodotorula mucilaginosa]